MLGICTQHLRYVFGILLLLCSTAVFAQTNGHTVQTTSSVRFFANNAPWADIHYTVNGGGQQNIRMTHNADNSNSYNLASIPAGAVVRYFMTIGVAAGGQTGSTAESPSVALTPHIVALHFPMPVSVSGVIFFV